MLHASNTIVRHKAKSGWGCLRQAARCKLPAPHGGQALSRFEKQGTRIHGKLAATNLENDSPFRSSMVFRFMPQLERTGLWFCRLTSLFRCVDMADTDFAL
jgi:hypothetical protein